MEILSNNFENVDTNMKYSEIVDQISNEMTELEEENNSLNDKLNEITSEKEKLKTELDEKDKAISNETTTNEEKTNNPVVEQTKTTGNFIELCQPYEISDKVNYVECKTGKSFEMAGEKRTNGFTNLCYNTYVLFNLNGKYNELNFDIGHVDGEQMIDANVSIYFDGQYYDSYEVKAEGMPYSVSIPVKDVKQLKITFEDGRGVAMYSTRVGLADMIIK